MILFLNTIEERNEVFLIDLKGQVIFKKKGRKTSHKEDLLEIVDIVLDGANVLPEQIKYIGVLLGPGSFSSTRYGVVVANALAYAWQVPVFGLSRDEFYKENWIEMFLSKLQKLRTYKPVTPIYSHEPNITIKKKD